MSSGVCEQTECKCLSLHGDWPRLRKYAEWASFVSTLEILLTQRHTSISIGDVQQLAQRSPILSLASLPHLSLGPKKGSLIICNTGYNAKAITYNLIVFRRRMDKGELWTCPFFLLFKKILFIYLPALCLSWGRWDFLFVSCELLVAACEI